MGRWAEAALTVMNKTLMACREDGKTPAETAKAIDEAYPFGERAHHPYKVWLRERRLFFANHGLPRNGKQKTQKSNLTICSPEWKAGCIGRGLTLNRRHDAMFPVILSKTVK